MKDLKTKGRFLTSGLLLAIVAISIGSCGTSEAPKSEPTPSMAAPAPLPSDSGTLKQATDSLPVDSLATPRPDPRRT